MKLRNLLPLFLIIFSFSLFAQGGRMKEKKEKIKTLKVAFITNELSLTPSEAEKFWPVFNAFDAKQFEIRQQKMKANMDRLDDGSLDRMSEREAMALLNQMESSEDELHQLRKKLIASLKDIISPIKIIKLKKAEEDFNRKLLEQYRNRGPRR